MDRMKCVVPFVFLSSDLEDLGGNFGRRHAQGSVVKIVQEDGAEIVFIQLSMSRKTWWRG